MKGKMLAGIVGAALVFALSDTSWAAIRCHDGKSSFTPSAGATPVTAKGTCPSGTAKKSYCGGEFHYCIHAPTPGGIFCQDGKSFFTPPEGATAVSAKGECPSGTGKKSYCGGGFHYCVQLPTPWIVLPGETLKSGKSVYSKKGLYSLMMQANGNLVYYKKGGKHTLWASNTSKHSGARATMQTDGNLVVFSKAGQCSLGFRHRDVSKLICARTGRWEFCHL